jgi:SAM-dependent methyltransferase
VTDLSQRYYAKYPITVPSHNVARIAGRHIRDQAAKYFSGRMLEIGCGSKAKGLLVGDFIRQHIGLDLPGTPHDQSAIDIFGTAYKIPLQDSSCECVLSTAVLEHLEEPSLALCEALRVLRPGGHAIYTAPLFWHIHEEPRDFYRYTRYGLKYLFEKAGFQIIEIKPLSGFWITFGAEWGYYLQRFKRGAFRYFVNAMVVVSNWLFPKLDHWILRNERFTWMYLLVVRKPL